jgi:hypothetical protein
MDARTGTTRIRDERELARLLLPKNDFDARNGAQPCQILLRTIPSRVRTDSITVATAMRCADARHPPQHVSVARSVSVERAAERSSSSRQRTGIIAPCCRSPSSPEGAIVNRSRRAQRNAATLLGSIAVKLLRLGWLYCCLGVLHAAASFPRYWPCVLRRTAVLGAAFAVVFEFVLRVPDFPFVAAMQIPIACAALLALHRLLVAAAKPYSS